MKTRKLGISVITVSVLALAVATAQLDNLRIEDSEPAQPAPQKLIRVSSLNTVQANQEFDRNVRLLQAQRERAVQLANAIETAQTDEAKSGLQQELDALMEKLNENNKKMVQAYGFSLTRNYTRVIETSHIYMFVTDEEAARYEERVKNSENE